MRPWSLLDHVTPEGRNSYQEWYGTLDPDAHAAIDRTVSELSEGYDDWTDREGKEFRQFTEEEVGLSAIRISILAEPKRRKFIPHKRRIRVLGLYRPELSEFIFLGGFEKTYGGLIKIPANALERAMKRKQQVEDGEGSTREHV